MESALQKEEYCKLITINTRSMEYNRHRTELPTLTPSGIIVGGQHPCDIDIAKSHSRQAIQILDGE
ncbi:MAG: hypothetical protein ACI8RD_000373 [Bacillariaceae sp.]|jgi:hypothetical protein